MPIAAVNLIKPFWDICRLKRMPQDIPASRFLFNVVLCTYLLLATVFNMVGSTIAEACLFSLLMTTLLLVFIRILLLMRHYDGRMLQTATALMGASIVLFPPRFALRYWFYIIENSGTESNLAGYLWICLFIWERFISAHILRHALNIRFMFGFLISVGYVFFEYQIIIIFHRAVAQWLT